MNNVSFRDPSGFLFIKDDVLYRQINGSYSKEYDLLFSSGLYKKLTEKNLLLSHEESAVPGLTELAHKVIKPEFIDFISYPYEWSFPQLKDAALATLKIQKIALKHGMSLKDASAYNIQFHNGAPVFIDTLSFEAYKEGQPWVAYRQFCQHFLAPLALMAYTDVRLNSLLRNYIDGIPLDLACKLLPRRTLLNFSLLSNLHLHARAQNKYEDSEAVSVKKISMSQFSLTALITSLESCIRALKSPKLDTEWGDYYNNTNYQDCAFEDKKKIIEALLTDIKPEKIWDLGANTGEFSRLASERGIKTVAFDIDPVAVEVNYLKAREYKERNILPLLLDLTNPSPAIGWANEERGSLVQRGRPDTVMALALIHHLAISNNLPLKNIARYFAELAPYLIIEFVPKSDSKVKILLRSRPDIFPNYTEEGFENAFGEFFTVRKKCPISNSERTLYLMQKREAV